MIEFSLITDFAGDAGAAGLVGAAIGLSFGFLAQRSSFCVRSAALELVSGRAGAALPVWLATLGAAILATQYLVATGQIELTSIRQLSEPTSLSAAMFGGLMFGVGMALARGCPSRHLVLAATGNLRSWVVISVFALVAIAAIAGPLSAPVRWIAGLWTVSPDHSDLLANLGVGTVAGMMLGGAILSVAITFAIRRRATSWSMIGGIGIGLLVALCWGLTSGLSGHTFEPTQVESLSFTAPLANTLTYVVATGAKDLSFDIGFVPAVLFGALLAALLSGELRWQRFTSWQSTFRYIAGAALMSMGSVMALGCAVGNLSNATVMIATSWAALGAIWLALILTERILAGLARTPAAIAHRRAVQDQEPIIIAASTANAHL
jgi:uncharacterized membrane protein YedE/YeeE